jgi:maltose O-acetyltransferase
VRDELINRLIRYPGAIAMRLRIARLRLLGMRVGRRCWVRRIRVPRNPWDIALEDGVALDDDVVLLTTGARQASPRLVIGSGTYVNRSTMFDVSEGLVVGRDCMIGPFCYITDHDHGQDLDRPIGLQPLIGGPVHIGDNVWIGAGVMILKQVRIGDGATVAAGAVVTKDVAAGAKVAGVPAREIGRRA